MGFLTSFINKTFYMVILVLQQETLKWNLSFTDCRQKNKRLDTQGVIWVTLRTGQTITEKDTSSIELAAVLHPWMDSILQRSLLLCTRDRTYFPWQPWDSTADNCFLLFHICILFQPGTRWTWKQLSAWLLDKEYCFLKVKSSVRAMIELGKDN